MTTTTMEFDTLNTPKAPDEMLPHAAGRKLWLPMFLMAFMGFAVGIVLAFFKADAVNSGEVQDAAALGQFVPAFMFIGFTAVFSAIAFAIAKILGAFRAGGSDVQEAAGTEVQTLNMPPTGRAFIGLMMMAMMLIVGAVVLHLIVGTLIASGNDTTLANAEQWSIWLEAARRFGTTTYLFSILLGLATIIYVVRFQTVRIREIATR
ncbi:MAG: hypothetical protein BMS9Abin07_0815 [Acidimicrobiia bacterium]|nr:MAG: hypothetical protein BMS9Abin07_0815 [Acidimicrobiia bacterium]